MKNPVLHLQMKKPFLCLLCLTVLLCGCAVSPSPNPPTQVPADSQTSEPEVPLFQFTEGNFPRLDGSTANIPLGEATQALLLGKPREECPVDFTGTNSAYMRLMDDAVDIVIAYEMPDAARAYMKENADRELLFAEIGRDALVFLINSSNSVTDLTTKQIQDIYTGKITNWQDVGGDDAIITPYQRNATSGSQTLMEKLVMKNLTMTTPPQDFLIEDMEGLVEAIAASYINAAPAIGYNVYYYVTQMRADPAVTLLSVNGASPSKQSISDGSYPLGNPFYAAIRKSTKTDDPARILYDWLQSADGAALVDHEGYAVGAR